MNIMSTSTGIVNLATASSRLGVCHLADGTSSTGGVHLNNGDTSSGNTQIMNGASQTGNLNLGATTNSVVIHVNRPLTIGYSPTAITTDTQIGYTVKDTIVASAVTSGLFTDLFTPITLPAGVWLVTYSIRFASTSATTVTDAFAFSNTGNPAGTNPLQISGFTYPIITTGGCSLVLGGTFVVTSTGSTTYTVQFVFNYTGSAVSLFSDTTPFGSSVRRVRIA